MPHRKFLSSIEEIIEEAKQGRMFILVDDEDRENEGDLVIPAEKADDKAINFMAKYGRGLICLALESKRIDELKLPLMSRNNNSRHETAFTISIEAREGVTTGISAADRARTIEVAIDKTKNSHDIVSPGHVFPLAAKEGGTLVRAGHTEAAVDIARLAGLNPSGVICEIMNDDGTMARMPDLIEISKQLDLKIATIADLIAYRRKSEKLVERLVTSKFDSEFGGNFNMHVYANKIEYAEHIVLTKGEVDGDKPVLVRMHALNILSDVLGDKTNNKNGELQKSMQIINEHGCGVIVLVREPQKNSVSEIIEKRVTGDSSKSSGLRDYGIGAQILLDLGVRDMILLSNSQKSIVGLEGYGLNVKGYQKIS